MYVIATNDGRFLQVSLEPAFSLGHVLQIKDALKFSSLFDLQLFSRMLETKDLIIYEIGTEIEGITMPNWFILSKISFKEMCR